MPDAPDNATLTAQVADSVNPASPQSQALLAKMSTARSYADSMNDATLGRARAVPGLDESSTFAKGLEQALSNKAVSDGGGQPETNGDETPGRTETSPATSAAPPPDRKLTDPPLRKATIQKHHFKDLKNELAQTREQWQAERVQLLQQIEQFKATPAISTPDPVVAEILKERDSLRTELAAYGAVKNPVLDAQQAATIRQAKNLSGDKGSLIETVLSMPAGSTRDAKLEEILSDLPASTASIVKAANQKLAAIEFERGVEVETAKATLGERQKQAEQQQLAQRASRSRDFDSLVSEWRSEIDALDPAKDKQATARIAQARQWFEGGNLSHKEQAAIVVQAALVPSLVEESQSLAAEVQRLRTALSRYEGSTPQGDARVEIDGGEAPPRNFEERQSQFNRGLDEAMRRDPTFAGHRRAKLY